MLLGSFKHFLFFVLESLGVWLEVEFATDLSGWKMIPHGILSTSILSSPNQNQMINSAMWIVLKATKATRICLINDILVAFCSANLREIGDVLSSQVWAILMMFSAAFVHLSKSLLHKSASIKYYEKRDFRIFNPKSQSHMTWCPIHGVLSMETSNYLTLEWSFSTGIQRTTFRIWVCKQLPIQA